MVLGAPVELEEEAEVEALSPDLIRDELDNMMAGVGRGEVFQGHSASARAFALTIFATEEVAKAYASWLILWLHDDHEPSPWDGSWEIIGTCPSRA